MNVCMRSLVEDFERETNYDAQNLQLKLKEHFDENIVLKRKVENLRQLLDQRRCTLIGGKY